VARGFDRPTRTFKPRIGDHALRLFIVAILGNDRPKASFLLR
jgi:hypothetical protein